MANANFTRDEVILALDTYYAAKGRSLSHNSPLIAQLCEELIRLPIYPKNKRPASFRNHVAVSDQISKFNRLSERNNDSSWNIGTIFFQVDKEYTDKHQELHAVAEAIRKNIPFYEQAPFGGEAESEGFREGALLGHLHRFIERRDGKNVTLAERCTVCKLIPEQLYKVGGSVLTAHLTVPPAELNGEKKYSSSQFITVCPNCHAALHRYRPWLTKNDCEKILY